MKRAMWVISFIALAGTAIVLQFMPDQVPMHYDAVGNIDRWGSKYENLIFPVIILAMSWRKSNRFGAYAIMIAGVVTIIMAVLLKKSFGAAMAAVGAVILASVATLIYAHKVYVQEI